MRVTRFAAALACGVLGAGCFIGPIDGGGYGEEGGKGGSGGAGGTAGAGGGGAADECESNQDCILEHQSETYLCRKDPAGNVCVNVLSEQCPRLFAELGDMGADPVVFGTLGAPSVAPPLAQAESALDLARRDFRNALGVALGRPVVWLSCDASITSPDDHVAATNHLIDELRVPAVVLTAPIPGWLAYLAERAEGRGAVAFSAFGFDDGPAGAPVFSNGPRPSDEARAQAAVVAVSEANARAEGQEGELRLVYLNPGTPFAEPAAQAFFTSVRFNGKSAQENGANYRELAYGNPASPDFGVTLAAALAEAAAFAPQLVACSGPGCEAAFLQLELVHPGAHYVLPASARSPEVRAKLGDEALRKRVLGTLPGRSDDDPVAATFDVRFAASFPDGLRPDRAARYAYDAGYALTYGLAAAGTAATGPELAQALRTRFGPGGLAKNVGTQDLASAWANVATGGELDLYGAGGDLHFDAGDAAPYEFQVWCAPSASNAPGFAETGLRYLSSGGLEGANGCF